MGKRSRIVLTALFALGMALVPAGRAAGACVTDADCDNGDSCSQPDQCISGNCVLGGGGDTNHDLICDAELDPNTTFNLTRIVIKKKTAGRDNSVAKGSGDLFTSDSTGGAFTAESGVSIRVKDSLASVPPPGDGCDITVSWGAADCKTKDSGTISCRTADGKSFVKFKPNPQAPGQFRFKFKMKGLGLAGPFFEPIQMVLTHDVNLRSSDLVTDCHLILAGLTCRVF
jgi:hypothetical protein